MDVHGGNAFGAKTGQGEPRILGEDAAAPAESPCAEPLVDDGGPLPADLEAEQTHVRAHREPLERESTAAGPDLDLDGALTGLEEGTRVEVLSFRKDRGIGVRVRLGHRRAR
jgi:hypothetical protein